LVTGASKVFNVAIRTALIDKNTGRGEIGIGSGVVWDSDPEKEFEESLLKADYLTKPEHYFELFETMLVQNQRIYDLEEHEQRLRESAEHFLFVFNNSLFYNKIEEILKADTRQKYILKILLNKWGGLRVETRDFRELNLPVKICISTERLLSSDKFYYFKTTKRDLYDRERELFLQNGFFEVIFFNESGNLAEGAISNIFVYLDNEWVTPPVESGLLAGIYRKKFINDNSCRESLLTYEDLINADDIVLTNSVRGKIEVDSIYNSAGRVWLRK
jgi:para-aminobenzoate synthetase/4-amino-4-deoxychorismate lyase